MTRPAASECRTGPPCQPPSRRPDDIPSIRKRRDRSRPPAWIDHYRQAGIGSGGQPGPGTWAGCDAHPHAGPRPYRYAGRPSTQRPRGAAGFTVHVLPVLAAAAPSAAGPGPPSGVLMTTAPGATPVPVVNLLTVLGSDFASACRGFRQARDLQRTKDTPAHRAAVAEAREGIDAVLDMYLATLNVTEVVA